ncbi:MAG: P27 family phage terminase small subunit [Colwellia sp.]|nr:P27 family phage terminase small subunit [Colwellia sp.]
MSLNKNDFISGKEAQEILEITTRQGLDKIVKRYSISKITQGAGKPNLYNKDEVMKAYLDSHKQKEKYNPSVDIKAKEKKVKKQTKATELKQKKKEVEEASSTPLNNIGQSEYLRVEKELKDLGLYEFKDRAILLAYAVCYQNYMFYTNLSAQLDHTTTDEGGNLKVHPYFTISDKLLSQMTKLSNILGIGKRSMMGFEPKKKEEDSLMATLLKG